MRPLPHQRERVHVAPLAGGVDRKQIIQLLLRLSISAPKALVWSRIRQATVLDQSWADTVGDTSDIGSPC